jgi:hypothetical protein
MPLMIRNARLSLLAAVCLAFAAPSAPKAQEGRPAQERQEARRPEVQKLPPESVTRHTLELPGRTLRFIATAGALTLTDQQGAP